MVKKYPKLEDDFMFKSQLGLDYFSDNPFKLNQEMDIINKRKEAVTAMGALVGDEDKPYFSNAFLIETYLGLSKQDIDANKEALERKAKEKKEKEKEEGGEEGESGGETAEAPASEETPPAEEGGTEEAPAES